MYQNVFNLALLRVLPIMSLSGYKMLCNPLLPWLISLLIKCSYLMTEIIIESILAFSLCFKSWLITCQERDFAYLRQMVSALKTLENKLVLVTI